MKRFETFNDVIHPVEFEDFVSNYFEQKPFVIKRNQPDYYEPVLTITDIDRILRNNNLDSEGFELVKYSQQLNKSKFTCSDINTGKNVIDHKKLFGFFDEGFTINVDQFHRYHRPLNRLVDMTVRTFYGDSNAYLFYTPAGMQGLKPHWDQVDVFILQIEGSKEWRVYDSPMKLPRTTEGFDNMDKEPILTAVLEKGDMLYMPRGFVHEAKSGNDISVHITLSCSIKTYGDLFKSMVADIADEYFDQSLPVRFNVDSDDFRARIKDYVATLDINEVIGKFRKDFFDKKVLQSTGIFIQNSGLDTHVKLKKKLAGPYSVKCDNLQLTLACSTGASIVFPVFAKVCIEFILEAEVFSVNEIPSDLSEQKMLMICKKLIHEGILEVLHPDVISFY